ncbi:TetR/AcrR family transcriptional regulator [Actinocorallia sp. A-T 12471]|uniref:TetR/AcrR family transcriptional regulator n=1 Tax=Actinocorallia sp. A-T 12471 TaxID=3089813 RepID=UPI0029D07F22|nr:TetR/AcrR family transcriptional regulator [Actinocorallia sp. A-T 12471]MDX6740908.1 TetR/AcrR family transcriptional regulator [Actinocorallia sp. A-T 12471]
MAVRGPDGVTRRRALVEASRLFAVRGYHGTSTRDIADAVGVRQPSLYRHFDGKAAILAELLDADLLPALARVRSALDAAAPPPVRLHAYLHADVAAILGLPYDVRGLYNDDVLDLPDLAAQAARRAELHALTARLVGQGVASGDLRPADPHFVRHAITGLLLEAVRERGPSPAPDPHPRAQDVADFILRATLADPTRLPDLKTASTALVTHWTTNP